MNTWEKSIYLFLAPVLGIVVTFLGEETPIFTLLSQFYFYTNLVWNTFSILLLFFYLNKAYQVCERKPRFSAWFTFLPIAIMGDLLILGLSYFYIVNIWGQSFADYSEMINYDLPNYLVWQLAYLFILKIREDKSTVPMPDHFLGQGETFPKQAQPSIPLKKGKEIILFPITSIYAVISKHGLVYIVDEMGKLRAVEMTMRDLEQRLNPESFFRINRQTIVSAAVLSGYQIIPNRKISISLIFDLETNLLISKEKAPIFKKWWNSQLTLSEQVIKPPKPGPLHP